MSAYDPRRSRPRPVVDDTEEAPIEALIGPDPDAVPPVVAEPDAAAAPASPGPEPDAAAASASSGADADAAAALASPGANGSSPDQVHQSADSAAPPVDARRPVPSPRSSAPSPLWQLAPLLAGLSLLAALVWWLTRRRQS